MPHALQLLAGRSALEHIRDNGLCAEDVIAMVGASGGPKWLTLYGLDRVLFGEFFKGPRNRELHLVGSSIGSWRMACYSQTDPVAAVDRFRSAYIEQRYTKHPPAAEVTRVTSAILDTVLGANGVTEILDHPHTRLHIITARSRRLTRSERRTPLVAGLVLTALANVVSRRALALEFERVVFEKIDADGLMHDYGRVRTRRVTLTRNNLRSALLASGSIPLVLEGVRVPDAPPGLYRDGGVLDYHPALNFERANGIVLYPHFYSHLTPGWFDQWLPWRKPAAARLDPVLMLAPTPEFVASLPHAKIPDRRDFEQYTDDERMRFWRASCAASHRLGEEFAELMHTGRWLERIRPIDCGR